MSTIRNQQQVAIMLTQHCLYTQAHALLALVDLLLPPRFTALYIDWCMRCMTQHKYSASSILVASSTVISRTIATPLRLIKLCMLRSMSLLQNLFDGTAQGICHTSQSSSTRALPSSCDPGCITDLLHKSMSTRLWSCLQHSAVASRFGFLLVQALFRRCSTGTAR